ncbi:DUF5103 domain-containing protein [Sediminibacterium ginsengisoli]|nr:DUF5103 domain-containing protein [Sediminibacterium ginsengisoli]
MKYLILFIVTARFCLNATGQVKPDHVYMNDIRTVKLFPQNNQQAMPLIRLNSADLLELHFDDMSGFPKNYYYTIELCNADWKPADQVSPFDYIKGFQQNRLTQYRMSSIANAKYVHYQATMPDRNCVPTKSGNYLLRVFLNGDTSQVAFTKRFMVVDQRTTVGARVVQPMDNQLMQTHQKIQFSVGARDLNILNPQQQAKVWVVQNNRWDEAQTNVQPPFIRNGVLEYSGGWEFIFPAGKEYRWADLRSFRFESDRVERVDRFARPLDIYMKPDAIRNNLRYAFFSDRNGWDEIDNTESVNPWWQSDYANVHFTLATADKKPLQGKNVYMVGELTGNQVGDTSLMRFDEATGAYTKTLFLKQGYYSYCYVTLDKTDRQARPDVSATEGNYWETENEYTIFFYFRSMGGRHDELLGINTINSRAVRN